MIRVWLEVMLGAVVVDLLKKPLPIPRLLFVEVARLQIAQERDDLIGQLQRAITVQLAGFCGGRRCRLRFDDWPCSDFLRPRLLLRDQPLFDRSLKARTEALVRRGLQFRHIVVFPLRLELINGVHDFCGLGNSPPGDPHLLAHRVAGCSGFLLWQICHTTRFGRFLHPECGLLGFDFQPQLGFGSNLDFRLLPVDVVAKKQDFVFEFIVGPKQANRYLGPSQRLQSAHTAVPAQDDAILGDDRLIVQAVLLDVLNEIRDSFLIAVDLETRGMRSQ